MKKTLITIIAIVVMASAIYSVWHWKVVSDNQPIRQEQDIR